MPAKVSSDFRCSNKNLASRPSQPKYLKCWPWVETDFEEWRFNYKNASPEETPHTFSGEQNDRLLGVEWGPQKISSWKLWSRPSSSTCTIVLVRKLEKLKGEQTSIWLGVARKSEFPFLHWLNYAVTVTLWTILASTSGKEAHTINHP